MGRKRTISSSTVSRKRPALATANSTASVDAMDDIDLGEGWFKLGEIPNTYAHNQQYYQNAYGAKYCQVFWVGDTPTPPPEPASDPFAPTKSKSPALNPLATPFWQGQTAYATGRIQIYLNPELFQKALRRSPATNVAKANGLLQFAQTNGNAPAATVNPFNAYTYRRTNMPTPPFMESFDDACSPAKYDCPDLPGVETELKGYQRRTVAWMYHLEEHPDETYEMPPPLTDLTPLRIDAKISTLDNSVIFPDSAESPMMMCSSPSGGILADEMGLGKTLTMLALATARQDPEADVKDRTIHEQDNFCHFQSKATLVVCPNQLAAQWEQEVRLHLGEEPKVILITTKRQWKVVTYQDLMDADFVIVSMQFFRNKCHRWPRNGATIRSKASSNEIALARVHWWRIVADEAHELFVANGSRYARKSAQDTYQKLQSMYSSHRWYMTGTPFPSGQQSLSVAAQFLEMEVTLNGTVIPNYSWNWKEIATIFKQHLYTRNTKESVAAEITDIPDYEEEVLMLKFTAVERALYEAAKAQNYNLRHLRQLCCHAQINLEDRRVLGDQTKSLDQVHDIMTKHNKKQIEDAEQDIKDNREKQTKLKAKRRGFESNLDKAKAAGVKRDMGSREGRARAKLEDRLLDIRKDLERLVRQEQKLMRELKGLVEAKKYFEKVVSQALTSPDDCVICYEKIDRLCVTPCGHTFCHQCILSSVHIVPKCPVCRRDVQPTDLMIVDENHEERLKQFHKESRLIQQHGTKMANVIMYLRKIMKNPDNRVILFSQWDYHYLRMIGSTLKDEGIDNVFCQGNVTMRQNAIRKFQDGEVQLIMLSLDKAASGTNLIEATHVVLIDPIAGTREEAVAVESQAIARAHRLGQTKTLKVVRFVIEDSIESELYERNRSEDAKDVVMTYSEAEQVSMMDDQAVGDDVEEVDDSAEDSNEHSDDDTMWL